MKTLLAFVVALVAVIGVYVLFEVRDVTAQVVTKDLTMLHGLGGNVGVLRTTQGAVIVDSMTTEMQGGIIRSIAEEIAGGRIAAVISTHYHLDHTHGNPAFDPDPTRFIATARTRDHLLRFDEASWKGAAGRTMPTETFDDALTLTIGGKEIRLIHPGRGHTDGDLIVHYVSEDVVQLGDLHFNNHYPNIDLEAGGSVQAWPATLERVLEIPFSKVIPGHGAITDRAGVRRFQSFMAELAEAGRTAQQRGWDLETTLANVKLTTDEGYVPVKMIVPIGLDRDFVVTRAWEEVTGQIRRQYQE